MAVAVLLTAAVTLWKRRPLVMGPEVGIRNLLLVTFDTTRADAVGCYGNLEASTVNLDRMADTGVLMERCFSTAPITLPSHTSLLTGMRPYSHGARNNGTHYVPDDAVTLAEVLRDQDFVTGAVISAFVLDSRFGLDQGFDVYDADLTNAEKAPMFMFRETKAEDTSRRAREFLEARSDERWFLWVHYFDPHAHYAPPEAFQEICPDSPYDGEIAYADAGLGELMALLEKRGMLEETLVMMTSDHGEAFGDHGESTHGIFIYDATTHVPWISMHPALAQGKRVRDVVSGVDLFPTALEILGVPLTHYVEGRSLARILISPDERPTPGIAYSESMNPLYNLGWSDLRAIRDNSHRYIKAPREELYDVRRDSAQKNNLAVDDPDVVIPWQGQLEHLLATGEMDVRGQDISSMDPEARDALAALGYVWTPEGKLDASESDLPDPKDRVHMWEKSQFANQLVRLGQLEEAEVALREVLAEDPGSILPRSALIGVLMSQKRYEEAHEIELETIALPGVRTSNFVRLAEIERRLEIPTWKERLERAKEFDPRDPLPWISEGDHLSEAGNPEEAIEKYEKALEIDDQAARAWIGIGNTRHREKRDEEAINAFKAALEIDPVSVEAHYNLGVLLDKGGKPGLAEQAYRQAVEVNPDHLVSLVNLANLKLRSGRLDPAEELYRRALKRAPEDYNALFNYGMCKLRQDEAGKAVPLFARAAESRPTMLEPLLLQGAALATDKQFEEALGVTERVLEMNESHVGGLLQAAAIEEDLGRREQALIRLREALELGEERVRTRAKRDEKVRTLLDVIESNAPAAEGG